MVQRLFPSPQIPYFACHQPRLMRQLKEMNHLRKTTSRAGAAALEYVLILSIVLPMIALVLWAGPRIMGLAYEMVCALVAWPFM
jgi:hypothetical protein